jgi:hypothetical protein
MKPFTCDKGYLVLYSSQFHDRSHLALDSYCGGWSKLAVCCCSTNLSELCAALFCCSLIRPRTRSTHQMIFEKYPQPGQTLTSRFHLSTLRKPMKWQNQISFCLRPCVLKLCKLRITVSGDCSVNFFLGDPSVLLTDGWRSPTPRAHIAAPK